MSDSSRVDELSQRVTDGLADEATMIELEGLLREDPSARVAYLQTVQLHQDLERKAARGTLGAEANGNCEALPRLLVAPTRPRVPFLAATIVILLGLGSWFWFSQPTGIGQWVEISGVQWRAKAPGDTLRPHQRIELQSGSVELRLASGVRVVLQGEVDAVIKSPMEIALHDGQLFAAVPKVAHGFRVTTPGMQVVDLGTQFGVRVEESGTDVHVFGGEVAVEADDDLSSTQSLTTAQAAKFDLQGQLTDWIAPDYEGFAAPVLAPGVVSTSQAVHWGEHPASSLGITDDRHVTLILERRNVWLAEPLEITFGPEKFQRFGSGTNSAYDSHREVLAAGTRVDSYLLHFHPQDSGSGPNGGVQFDRPILGAIARGDQLEASDAILGLSNVNYPKGPRRGLEGDPKALDVIRFGRHQLGVRFWASETKVDQVRILLEARSPVLLQPEDHTE